MGKSARLVICLDNSGYEVSLERRKIYVGVRDAKAQRHGQLRVVDESGEGYLYPADIFIDELPLAPQLDLRRRRRGTRSGP
jgi:hypothetical protein